jgi:hypothetical protein
VIVEVLLRKRQKYKQYNPKQSIHNWFIKHPRNIKASPIRIRLCDPRPIPSHYPNKPQRGQMRNDGVQRTILSSKAITNHMFTETSMTVVSRHRHCRPHAQPPHHIDHTLGRRVRRPVSAPPGPAKAPETAIHKLS